MNDEQLKRLCEDLARTVPRPALGFRLEGACSVPLRPGDGPFDLGASGIRCRLRDEKGRLILEVASEDGFLARQSVWAAGRGGDGRVDTEKVVLREADTGGCEGRLDLGPLDKVPALGPDPQLTVYPPRIDKDVLMGLLLDKLRRAENENQRRKALDDLIRQMWGTLRRKLAKKAPPQDRDEIENALKDALNRFLRPRRKDFGPKPFRRLVGVASRRLREILAGRPAQTLGPVGVGERPPAAAPAPPSEETPRHEPAPDKKKKKRKPHDHNRPRNCGAPTSGRA